MDHLSKNLVSDSELVPVTVAYEIFGPIVSTLDWNTIGLQVGESLQPLDLGLLGYYLHSCPDLLTAYEKLVRYQALVSDVANFHVEQKQDLILWYLTTPMSFGYMDDRMVKVVTDLGMASRHGVVEKLAQGKLVPAYVEVVYRHAQPQDTRSLESFYGCEVIFGQRYNKIAYRSEDVQRSIPTANPKVFRLLGPVLDQRMDQLYGKRNQTEMVEQLIRSNIGLMNCTLENIAFKLNMSPRNLQRRLRNENTRFHTLLENVQKEVAKNCRQNGMTAIQIAELLGYRETNSFLRAFKRWYGVGFSKYEPGSGN